MACPDMHRNGATAPIMRAMEWNHFTEYMLLKALAVLVVVGVVGFLYAFKTGRSISEDLAALNGSGRSGEEGPTGRGSDRR